MESNIVSEVSQGRETFLKIQKDIQHAVNQTIPVVSASIRRACDYLESVANNMTALIDRINVDIDRVYIRHLEVARVNIDQYSPYRYVKWKGLEINISRQHLDVHEEHNNLLKTLRHNISLAYSFQILSWSWYIWYSSDSLDVFDVWPSLRYLWKAPGWIWR